MPGQFQIQSKHDHQKFTQKPVQPPAPAQTLFAEICPEMHPTTKMANLTKFCHVFWK